MLVVCPKDESGARQNVSIDSLTRIGYFACSCLAPTRRRSIYGGIWPARKKVLVFTAKSRCWRRNQRLMIAEPTGIQASRRAVTESLIPSARASCLNVEPSATTASNFRPRCVCFLVNDSQSKLLAVESLIAPAPATVFAKRAKRSAT
jgi:hypothetical protein